MAGIGSLEALDGALEGVIPCMPRGSLTLVFLSSSLVPRMPIHICIKNITEQQIYIYIYIYIYI